MEFTLLFQAGVGMLAVYAMLWWEGRRGNAAACSRDLWEVALAATVAGLFIGRIAAMIADGVNPLTNPGDLIIVRAGVSTGWATLGALGVAAWNARDDGLALADGLAAAALAGLAGWHAGCLAREACLGTPSDLPWALSQAGSTITRHPVELYAALALGVVAVLVAVWKTTVPPRGAPTGVALAMAGAIRLATEPLRPSLGGGPVLWYVGGVVAGVAILAFAYAGSRRHRASRTGPPP